MATDYLSALNAGSGLNVPQIVDALVDAERVPKQQKIDEAKETATVKISALGTLKNELSVFQTNTAALDGQIGLALSSSTSNVTLSRTDSSIASEFSHTINVSSIANGQVLNFNNGGSGFSSITADIGIDSLTIDLGTWATGPAFTANGTSSTFSLTAGATSLTDVRDAINNSSLGVTASIIEVYKKDITSRASLFDAETTFVIVSIVFTLSPGTILSGLYPVENSLLKVRLDFSTKIGVHSSSVTPG